MAEEKSAGSARSSISSAKGAEGSISNAEAVLSKVEETANADLPAPRSGMKWTTTSYFLIAQMSGAGFLSLPYAMANTGWVGAFMMVVFCAAVGLAGTRLGICWVMLEERWPEIYLSQIRQPYPEIAERALGKHGRRLALASVLITLVGGTTVFIILIAQMTNALLPQLSICVYVLIYGFVLMPCTWLGTPKDFWQASVLAVIATAIACLVVVIELFVTEQADSAYIQFPNATFSTFASGFGAILFAFGGASTFPTIQNDMKNRSEFWKSVVVAFIGILTLYLPVAASGYGILGSTVESNILLSLEFNGVVKAAIVLEIVNLLGTYIISFNPIGQAFEEMFNVPKNFGWKRIVLRSSVVLVEMFTCLAVPDFGLILNLIGGSTVTLCSFVLPPIMYMRLVDVKDPDPKWPKRTIPMWLRIAMWEIVIVGVIGGISSTVVAFIAIFDSSLTTSCLTDFSYGVVE